MSPDFTPHAMLTGFLLEQIAEQPAATRIILYRALAVDTTDKELAAECRAQADALEAVRRREHQMLLNFKRRNS